MDCVKCWIADNAIIAILGNAWVKSSRLFGYHQFCVCTPHLLSRRCLFSSLVKHRVCVIAPRLHVLKTVTVYRILNNQTGPTMVIYHHFGSEINQVRFLLFSFLIHHFFSIIVSSAMLRCSRVTIIDCRHLLTLGTRNRPGSFVSIRFIITDFYTYNLKLIDWNYSSSKTYVG